MPEKKNSWIDHPAFISVNKEIIQSLRGLAYDYHLAIKSGNLLKAIELIDQAKKIKRDNFPFEIISGENSE